MSMLFDVKQFTVSEHISNIFKEGELEEQTSIGISDKSSGGRKSKIYNFYEKRWSKLNNKFQEDEITELKKSTSEIKEAIISIFYKRSNYK